MAVTPFKSSDNFNMAGFNEKITEVDNTYVAKTGGSMSGALSMGNNKITDVASPVNDGDAANKGYVDGINKIKIASYRGTGTSEVTLTFESTPKFVYLQGQGNGLDDIFYCSMIWGVSPAFFYDRYSSQNIRLSLTWSNNSVIISEDSTLHFNVYNNVYTYCYFC